MLVFELDENDAPSLIYLMLGHDLINPGQMLICIGEELIVVGSDHHILFPR